MMRVLKKLLFAIGVCTVLTATLAQTFKAEDLPVRVDDTIAQVQSAMQISDEPKPYESVINPDGLRLPIANKGIYVFFDKLGKVTIIRLEKKFVGAINQVMFGDTEDMIKSKMGDPVKKTVTSNGLDILHYTYDAFSTLEFELGATKQLQTMYVRRVSKNRTNTTSVQKMGTNNAPADKQTRNAQAKEDSNDKALEVLSLLFVGGGPNAYRTYQASGYLSTVANMDALKDLKDAGIRLRAIRFENDPEKRNKLWCRGSFPVYGPNRTAFSPLLEAAFNMDLIASEVLNPNLPKIIAKLDEFDFSSFGEGKWIIQATFSAEGKSPLTLRHEYPFTLAMMAASACENVNRAMPLAIGSFLLSVFKNPQFLELNK
jgi:hypothetical protein